MKTRQTLRRALSCLLDGVSRSASVIDCAAIRPSAGLQAGRIGANLGADRALSRLISRADLDGFDVSARSGPGRPICQTERKPQGRGVDQSAGIAKLGSERQVAGQFSPGADDDERASSNGRRNWETLFSRSKSRSWIPSRVCAPRRKRPAISRRPKSRPLSSKRKSSRSSLPVRRWSTCRATIPRWYTALGRTRLIRPTPIIRPDM